MAQVLLSNGVAPSTPAAGYVALYSKAVDKLIYFMTEAGVEHKTLSSKSAITGTYAPGSFTVATNSFGFHVKRLTLSGVQRCTLSGTARLRIT